MAQNKMKCAHCGHLIDASAKLCPYCGANPNTGRKVDTAAIVETHFPRRQEVGFRERFFDFFRMRQSLVLSLGIAIFLLLILGAYQLINLRSRTAAAPVPAVPLTEVTDLASQEGVAREIPMPELEFQTSGNPKRVRTMLMEPGEIPPQPTPSPSPGPADTTTASPVAR